MDATEWADSDGDGIGDNADPFPLIANTATPNASTTRLISEGFNQPKTDPQQWQIFSTNTSSYYIERAREIQNLLNESFGGYMNYNLLVYEEEGPDQVNQPVFDRLITLGFNGEQNWSTQELEVSAWTEPVREISKLEIGYFIQFVYGSTANGLMPLQIRLQISASHKGSMSTISQVQWLMSIFITIKEFRL